MADLVPIRKGDSVTWKGFPDLVGRVIRVYAGDGLADVRFEPKAFTQAGGGWSKRLPWDRLNLLPAEASGKGR